MALAEAGVRVLRRRRYRVVTPVFVGEEPKQILVDLRLFLPLGEHAYDSPDLRVEVGVDLFDVIR
jgi:hypothetical protein